MPPPTYVKGFPQDGSSLGNTRVQIRNNLDGTFDTLAVDHVDNNGNPSTGTPGYHRVIHFQDQGSAIPSPVANTTQLYTGTDSHSIQQLKVESAAGNVYKQTTMLDAFYSRFGDALSINVAGWTYLPGGLIMNYGYTPLIVSGGTVDFTALSLPTFSSSNYIVNITPFTVRTNFQAIVVDATKFNITTNNSSGFNWTAIGKPA
jgi:FlaG/FlaF family flagellin (archaellin)